METPVHIKKSKLLKEVEDLAFLKKQGIEYIQNLSGDIWTDFNEHDPGITILEYLCYALTELGYKTNFPDEDFLFLNNLDDSKGLDILYPLNEVLSNRPVTTEDYRVLFIDQIKNVKNAWVIPKLKDEAGVDYNGLYDIHLQLVNQVNEEETIKDVIELYHANRNLCEDIREVKVLQSQKISFHVEISINPDFIVENVVADLLYRVSEHISPTISLHSFEEMLEKKYTKNEIFQGPKAENGFVDKKELKASTRENLYELNFAILSQIVDSTVGVVESSNFRIIVDGIERNDKKIYIEKDHYPTLDIDLILSMEGALDIFVGDVPYEVNFEVAKYSYQANVAKGKINHKRNLDVEDIERISNVDKADLLKYESIQNSFPKSFGITPFGIQGRVTEERIAEVSQLKGYLFTFEKLLSNQLAQIANVRNLFSAEKLEQTYFEAELPNNSKVGGREILPDNINEKSWIGKYDNYLVRRNRILNHLLARFGEEFMAGNFEFSSISSMTNTHLSDLKNTIESKERLIKEFIAIGSSRLKAYNYRGNHTSLETISGYKRKISYLFGFPNAAVRKLSEFAISSKKLTLRKKKASSKKSPKSEFSFTSKNPNILSELLLNGLDRNNYQILADRTKSDSKNAQFSIVYSDPIKNYDVQTIYKNTSREKCEEALTAFIKYLSELGTESDGFQILEHILLRPIELQPSWILRNKEEILLMSEGTTDQASFTSKLIQFGKDAKSYKLEKIGQKHKIALKDDKGKIFASNDSYVIKKSAQEAIKNMVAFIKEMEKNNNGSEFVDYHKLENAVFDISNPLFFSNKLSIILPKWSFRFRAKKHRMIFENIARINLPAHLNLEFIWLDIQEMAKFENLYFPWLEMKKSDHVDNYKLNQLSMEMAKFLGYE